jgi:hypothetical protein
VQNCSHREAGGSLRLSARKTRDNNLILDLRLAELSKFDRTYRGRRFRVAQPNISGSEQAEEFAQRLSSAPGRANTAKAVRVVHHRWPCVALAPVDGDTPERLPKSADPAVYKARAEGRNCVRFFRSEMDAELQDRLEFEEIIHNAVLRLIGFEALI